MDGDKVQNVEKSIVDILVKHVGEIDEVNLSSTLKSIGVNSLAYMKILLNIEQDFNIEFEDEYLTFGSFDSVGKLINYVKKRVNDNN